MNKTVKTVPHRTDKQVLADFYKMYPVTRISGGTFDLSFKFPRKRKLRKVATVRSSNPNLSVWANDFARDPEWRDYLLENKDQSITVMVSHFDGAVRDFVKNLYDNPKPELAIKGYGDSPLCDGWRTGLEIKFETEVEMARWFVGENATFHINDNNGSYETVEIDLFVGCVDYPDDE